MYRQAREIPSFSSSLLDEIYRSIDERGDHESRGYRETAREKQNSFSVNEHFHHDRDVKRLNNSCHGRDFRRSSQRTGNSTSSSSDSSSGGCFSSSEAESVYYVSSRPKPIRTSSNRHDEYTTRAKQNHMYDQRYQFDDTQSKQKHESKFVKTKSRAMKIYGDLKKVKQPISPGGRLATFLNSIFTTSNTKNTKISTASTVSTGSYDDGRQSKSATGSTCSSASSFSRSCLSKTPSSRGKLSNNKKRSVRFYPVSVIVGDDSQPCGQKSLYEHESNLHALKFVKKPNDDEPRVYSNEKTRRIEEAARSLLRNYQKKVECEFDLITSNVKVEDETDLKYEDDDDDDDVASNASSDLFELENFSAIGMVNYEDELPVYETTHLGNGFRM